MLAKLTSSGMIQTNLRRLREEDMKSSSNRSYQKQRRDADLPADEVREMTARDDVREHIARQFKSFLLTYVNPKNGERGIEYVQRIHEMVSANRCTLEIVYSNLSWKCENVTRWLKLAPQFVLEIMEEVAASVVFSLYHSYKKIHQKIFVRIKNTGQVYRIRGGEIEPDSMIRLVGVVTRCSEVFSQLELVIYKCNKCASTRGPFIQYSYSDVEVRSCWDCLSEGLLVVKTEQTIYNNCQKLTLQEIHGIVPAGQPPTYTQVILSNDLIGCAKLGEEIDVSGIYKGRSSTGGFPVFPIIMEANYVAKNLINPFMITLSSIDEYEVKELARDTQIGKRIIKSIAPSIYGHEDVKSAISLAMFGGQGKNVSVLLLGEPGTTESPFMKFVEKAGHRTAYTTGEGDSAVGLSPAVIHDPVTKEWTLERGALDLGDNGICLIDEIDKMTDQDRGSILEVMEKQSISILNSGKVTSLPARCSIIATVNPIGGRFDSSKTFAQNVELTDPFISCFDIICIVKDVADPPSYGMLSRSVLNDKLEIISQDWLKKYITYANVHVFPRLNEKDNAMLKSVYNVLRKETCCGDAAATRLGRHIRSIVRISEARARMHLRQHVTEEDINMAIRLLVNSFISTQKLEVQNELRKSLGEYIALRKEYNELLVLLLGRLVIHAERLEEIPPGLVLGITYIDAIAFDLQARLLWKE